MDETPHIGLGGQRDSARAAVHGALICTRCGSDRLEPAAGYLGRPLCGAMFPLLCGVPVMFADSSPVELPRMNEATARDILDAFKIPVDAVSILRLRRASGRGVRTNGEVANTEGAQFLDRVRATGHALWPAPEHKKDAEVVAAASPNGDSPRYRWLRDYVPRRLPPRHELTCNLRFENTGRDVTRSSGSAPVTLVYRWMTEDADPVEHPDQRTPLPVDVLPGRQLTAPIRLTTPSATGRFLLRLLMVEEGVRFLERDARTFVVRVAEGPAPDVPPGWTVRPEVPESYDADHARAVEMLRDWLRGRAPAALRILEIGGNANPMVAGMPGERYNVDVDLLGLQVCRMAERAHDGGVRPVCADVDRLPFPRGFLDVIVIAASLHHFPDPAASLTRIRDRLAPGGFIAVLCEPVGHIWPGAVDPAFLAELAKGVNEQSFVAAEYGMMFQEAGLTAEEAVVDVNSLKARLVPTNAPAV